MRWLFFIASFLFGFNITETIPLNIKASPTHLKTHIQIVLDEKDLSKLFSKIEEASAKLKPLCQKITYNFNPIYKNNKFFTYRSYLNAECTFEKSKIKKFSNILAKTPGIKRLSSIHLTIPESEKEKIIKNLKLQAYKKALKRTEIFSKQLQKTCILKNISFNTPVRIMPKAPLYRIKKAEALPPPKEDKIYNLFARYTIECF